MKPIENILVVDGGSAGAPNAPNAARLARGTRELPTLAAAGRA